MHIYESPPDVIRFQSYLDADNRWTGGRDYDGYGIFQALGRTWRAHRVAWEIAAGMAVPPGLFVLHSCDDPPCCDPACLWLGTPAQNSADMVRKGRSARGERCAKARLTGDAVRAIRTRWASGGETQSAIAAAYGVTQGTVSKVLLGATWAHVPEIPDA